MRVDKIQQPRTNKLTQAYIERDPSATRWYEWDPRSPEAYSNRAKWVTQTNHQRANRAALVDALLAYNQAHNPHPNVLNAIHQLRDENTLVVIGGQQPGLFTGPLLVMAKIIHIIHEAKKAAATTGQPVIPVFWIAGDDHDWDEVDHTYVQQANGPAKKIKLPRIEQNRLPLSFIPLTEHQRATVIEQLVATIPDHQHKPEIIELFNSCLVSGDSISDSFAKLIGHLFGQYGLVLIDAAEPAIRHLEVPFFTKLIQESSRLQQAIQQQCEALLKSGYATQVEHLPEQANLFVVEQGQRTLLFHDGQNGYRDRQNRWRISTAHLVARLADDPTQFSTNVLTRPLMQEYLFPVVSTVLGPAEVAYWGMLKQAFAHIDFNMPILIPRTEWTVIEADVQKRLAQFDLAVSDAITANFLPKSRQTWLAQQEPIVIAEAFSDASKKIRAEHQRLLSHFQSLPGIDQVGDKNFAQIARQLDYLQSKMESALHTKHEVALRKWDELEHALRPLGKPQERVYNVAVYLAKYGRDWIDEWVTAADADFDHHHVLML